MQLTEALEQAIYSYGQPNVITSNNGTEFTSNHFDRWAYKRGIGLNFITPGRPVENALLQFRESGAGSLRRRAVGC